MFRPSRRPVMGAWLSLLVVAGACAPDDATAPTEPTVSPTPVSPPTIGSQSSARRPVEGYPTRGALQSGWVIGRDGLPMQITYEVHAGAAIWEGDIDLGPAQEISSTPAGAKPYLRPDPDVAARIGQPLAGVALSAAGFRWPGGVVPYVIDPALPDQQRIADAIAMIENTTGGVVIRPRNGEADYVKFVPEAVCSSRVGRVGGEQLIKLTGMCGAGSTAHELLHALGMSHEHSRCDRDNFVEIQFDHIHDDDRHNFEKRCDGYTDHASYDFGSIMHYTLDALSTSGQPTIKLRPNQSYAGEIGQRGALGVADRITINALYGLNNIPPVAVICALTESYYEGTELELDGTCSTDADDTLLHYDWNLGDGNCEGVPQLSKCDLGTLKHTYARDGVYKLGLNVGDGYEWESTEKFITILNVAPDFPLNPVVPFDEGGRVGRSIEFTDPGADIWTASVSYGDGSPTEDLDTSGKLLLFGHFYLDNSPPGSPFKLSVSVKDDDITTTKTTDVEVRNVAPRVHVGDDVVLESGQSFNLSASFSDPGVLDAPWSWSVNWGGGTPSTGTLFSQDKIEVSRQMCAAGTYNVVVSVTDKDNATGTGAVQVTVGFVTAGLDISPGGEPNAVSLKKKGSLPVAILSSPTFNATTIDLASVRLGDGAGIDTPAELQKDRYVMRTADVNGDGLLDLVTSFDVQALVANGDLTASTTSLMIQGSQGASGGSCVNFRGSDAVVIVGS